MKQHCVGDLSMVSVTSHLLYVEYEMSVKDAVKLGRYDKTDSNITAENFPTNRTGADIVMKLVHFNTVVSSKDVLSELYKMGYRPAELHELLTFGQMYPDVQRGFPVVALGSVLRRWFRRRLVPCLFGDDSWRVLTLDWFSGDWHKRSQFAAVYE